MTAIAAWISVVFVTCSHLMLSLYEFLYRLNMILAVLRIHLTCYLHVRLHAAVPVACVTTLRKFPD